MAPICVDEAKEAELFQEAKKARVYTGRPALRLVRREAECHFPEAKDYMREIRLARLYLTR